VLTRLTRYINQLGSAVPLCKNREKRDKKNGIWQVVKRDLEH